MRIRFNLTKGDGVRFLSHLDYMQAFFRAARRAGLPVAFSEGFNPHPRIFFGSALSVGVSSDAEYADVEFSQEYDPAQAASLFNENLPPDIRVLAAVEVDPKAPALMSRLNRAIYRVAVRGTDPGKTRAACASLMEKEHAVVLRQSKKGIREIDIRPGIYRLEFVGGSQEDISEGLPEGGEELHELVLEMEIAAGNDFNVRPSDVIKALEEITGEQHQSLSVHRMAHFVEEKGKVFDPMKMAAPV